MTTGRVFAAGLGLFIVAAYAGGSWRWVQTDSTWVNGLTRPPWQPPDWVFGLIWPFHFTVLCFVMVSWAGNLTLGRLAFALACFACSVAAALAWSYLFYVTHQLAASTVALVIATLLTLPVLALTFEASTLLGWLLVPYQLWLGVATSLAWGYATLNR